MSFSNVGVIGLGLMGEGIAKLVASAGYETRIFDHLPGRAEGVVERNPELSLVAAHSLEEFADCHMIIEAIIETHEPKLELFRTLERVCPNAVFVSNSSTFMPSELAEAFSDASRLINCHFFNPAEIVPLVEVIAGPETNPAIAPDICNFLRRIGKTPVVLERETEGFVANRLQAAILRECYALVAEGVASPEDIDTVVRLSLAPRWAALGPIATADMGGLNVFQALTARLFPLLSNADHTPDAIQASVARGDVGASTGHGVLEWTREEYTEALERIAVAFARVQEKEPVSSSVSRAGLED